jgi:hypothetical protein
MSREILKLIELLGLYIYIYIYIYMCVCVCVCVFKGRYNLYRAENNL